MGGSAVRGVIPEVSIPKLGGGTSSSSSKYPANLCRASAPSRTFPSSENTEDDLRVRFFPARVEIALKAGPELLVNKCVETRSQTSLTLASSASLRALETAFFRERYRGLSPFSLAWRRLLMRSATPGGSPSRRFRGATTPIVSCAADVMRSRNDSQSPQASGPADSPDSWICWRNFFCVDSSRSLS